ncbi:alpha-hydroxy acid oxidase [Alteromonas sp. C1M14]|uniref:alpha-hydroxy acid oxidase n=1 Tax=Alteromonas sp. C1M14 TaxID=2841567 RepID=UPI001C09D8F0|nr:alpha-hydroxy acid oxidase [Alteromonas sp. C1M14]MBU2978044.1 alpha-hydroxy-acid oxidizing protein [Alteromonas sp. C1M14]
MPSLQIPSDIAALVDYEKYAKQHLSEQAWAYIYGGSADEITARQNEQVYGQIKILNRVLTDVSQGHTQTHLLGDTFAHPIILAPVAYQKLAHQDGEVASAMAAEAQGGAFVLSTLSSTSLETVAKSGAGKKWFQLYFQNKREHTLDLVRRAEEAGYRGLMITVDAPINGLRNREQRAGFTLPPGVRAENCIHYQDSQSVEKGASAVFQGLMTSAPTWDDIEWISGETTLPVIIKGIINPLDAREAMDRNVAGIVVSNHGGRTLDTLPSPIDVLPAIRQVVGPDFPLLIDSGIRRGTDIFKALALGANAVMIGRPIFYGLATAGALGVAHILRLLRDELELTMALCGCSELSAISSRHLWHK